MVNYYNMLSHYFYYFGRFDTYAKRNEKSVVFNLLFRKYVFHYCERLDTYAKRIEKSVVFNLLFRKHVFLYYGKVETISTKYM